MNRNGGSGAGKAPDAKGGRLRELAREASARLDAVLPEGEVGRAVQEMIGVAGSGAPPRREGAEISLRQAGDWVQRGAGRERARGGRALVSHVSPGVAGALANLLKHMGLSPTAASRPEDLEGNRVSGSWDLVLVQGSPMPWPGVRLLAATLRLWAESEAPMVLLVRPGERLTPRVAGLSVACTLEWPFPEDRVRRAVSELLCGARSS